MNEISKNQKPNLHSVPNKVISALSQIDTHFFSHASIMAGGFMGVGGAKWLMNYLAQIKGNDKSAQGLENLHMICSDAGLPGVGIGALIQARKVTELTASHVGLNKDVSNLVNEGFLTLNLVPQGSFVEKIRAGGAGLGGVLTPTGLGTAVAEGKQIISVKNKEYILEPFIKADIALLMAHKADTQGNLVIGKTCRNFNVVMATAANIVIVQADEIVEVGEIDPNDVIVPHIFVDYIVHKNLLHEYSYEGETV